MVAFKIIEVAIAMVFVLGAMEAAMIGTKFKKNFEPTDEEMAREIDQFLATIQSLFDPKKNMTDFLDVNGYFKCEDTHCRCCQRFLRREFCIVLEHLSRSDLLELSLKCGNRKIISRTFSVRILPPICFLRYGLGACLHLYSVRINHGKVYACFAVTAKFWFIKKKFGLGCFKIGKNNGEMELTKVMKLTHEMAEHAEQPAIWIKEGEPIVAFPDVLNLVMASSNVDQSLQDPDEK